MTSAQREVWGEMRERFTKSITTRVNRSQVDCTIAYNLHFAIFGKPPLRPNTTCNWDLDMWNLMIKNLNDEFEAV